jgi:hypothetical protein
VIKSEKRLGGACGTYGEKINAYRLWWENLIGKAHLEVPIIDGSTNIRFFLKDMEG